ncbi:hypothetical protein [Kocuria palustris]|uniref:hypothetical protein n=1 Tax=Kocuria palustris TaxID=71999 RepID=UPI0012E87C05|nr:hypothetical protein [Kocuria palustris]
MSDAASEWTPAINSFTKWHRAGGQSGLPHASADVTPRRHAAPPLDETASSQSLEPTQHRFCRLKRWHDLATRYEKHTIVYGAALLIHPAITWTRQFSDTPNSIFLQTFSFSHRASH